MARRYLIDKILPARQVHLIGGPSGIGKTRWIIHLIKDWLKGNQVLGFNSNPDRLMYFATDRNEESLEDTLAPFDINGDFKWKSLLNTKQSIEEIIKAHLGIRVFIFDPIMLFVPGYRYVDYGCVATFLRHLTSLCVEYDVTILGIVHTTKAKEGEGFSNPRERLLGSAAWGAYAETLFILGSDNFENPDIAQIRYVHVLPRNAKEFRLFWKFSDEGTPEPASNPASIEDSYRAFIDAIPDEIIINRTGLLQISNRLGISQSTMYRIIKQALTQVDLIQVKPGFYKKVTILVKAD